MCSRVEVRSEGLSVLARTFAFDKYIDQSCDIEPMTEEEGSPLQLRCTVIEDSDGKQPDFLRKNFRVIKVIHTLIISNMIYRKLH